MRLLVLFLLLSISTGAIAQLAPASNCLQNESVQFSCHIGKKTVSLCSAHADGKISNITYRYGAPNRIEKELTARPDNGNRFYGTVSPARPGASVSQVWFDQGDVRYLLTACAGGNCLQRAGLAVLKGDTIVMNGHCTVDASSDLAWFSSDMVDFGSGASDSKAKTDMLQIQEADNDLQWIYPYHGSHF